MYLGDFPLGATIVIPFATNAADGSRVAPSNAFEAADIEIYKAASDTQRASDSGVAITSTFDSLTGIQVATVDTSDNDDAGFWTPQSNYFVVLYPDETVDSKNVAAIIAQFSIENRFMPGLMNRTTIATLSSQTSFTLTGGSADNDAYNDCTIVVQDASTIVQRCVGRIEDYVGSTKTVTLKDNPNVFTMAAGDYITILAPTDRADVIRVRGQIVPVPGVTGEQSVNVTSWNGTAIPGVDTAGYPKVTIKSGTGTGELSLTSGLVRTAYGLRKNTALSGFEFLLTDELTGAPAPTLTVTAERSLDGAAFEAMANSVTEVEEGIYKINLAAADTNANTVTYKFTATGARPLYMTFVTQA